VGRGRRVTRDHSQNPRAGDNFCGRSVRRWHALAGCFPRRGLRMARSRLTGHPGGPRSGARRRRRCNRRGWRDPPRRTTRSTIRSEAANAQQHRPFGDPATVTLPGFEHSPRSRASFDRPSREAESDSFASVARSQVSKPEKAASRARMGRHERSVPRRAHFIVHDK
jgi:hypothetical protein